MAGTVKELFGFLAEQEEEHLEIFQGLFKKLQAIVADMESHIFMELPQLLAMANSHKFMHVDSKKIIKESRTPILLLILRFPVKTIPFVSSGY